jgi:methyl-accepting chemotaxis protein
MRKLTLGTRLTLGGILIVLVPLVIVGLLAVIKATDALTEVSREQAGNVAAKLAEMTQVAVSQELRVVKELALEDGTVETAAKVARGKAEDAAAYIGTLNRHLAGTMKQIGSNYEYIVVANPDGVVFADGNNGKAKGLNVADRD